MEATIHASHSVLVTNLSPQADEKTISDFFSFCGKIEKFYVKKGENTNTAVICFETESAAKTALLLTNALIADQPIEVKTYIPEEIHDEQGNTPNLGELVPQEKIMTRDYKVPDEQRTKTSVIASLIAAGYILGQDAIGKAKEFDEKHNLSVKAKAAVDTAKSKLEEFDRNYKITEKTTQLKQNISTKATQIDQEYHISEKITATTTAAKESVLNAAHKVQENPTVAKGISTINQTANSLKDSATNMWNDYKNQVDHAIEEKQKEKMKESPQTEEIQSLEEPEEKMNVEEVLD